MESIQDIIKREGLGRTFKGIWIPAEIWLNKELLPTEKILWAEIDSLEGREGCFASNSYFAKFLGVTERWVRKCLSKLSKKGLIRIENPKGKNRKIFTNFIKGTRNYPLLTRNSGSPLGGTPVPTDNIVYNINNNNKTKTELDLYPTVDEILKKHGLKRK